LIRFVVTVFALLFPVFETLIAAGPSIVISVPAFRGVSWIPIAWLENIANLENVSNQAVKTPGLIVPLVNIAFRESASIPTLLSVNVAIMPTGSREWLMNVNA